MKKRVIAILMAAVMFLPGAASASASQEYTIDPNALTYGQNQFGLYYTSEDKGLVHCEDFSCVIDGDSSRTEASSWSTYVAHPEYFHPSYPANVRYLRAKKKMIESK